ncbi:MAG: hypothetical protein H6734_27590 [Alphaproteobacteria bacterium]|nr:hypothetical protein [Alphaproteobacteria bacterium]
MGRFRLVLGVLIVLVLGVVGLSLVPWATGPRPQPEPEAAPALDVVDRWDERAFQGLVEMTLTSRSGAVRNKLLWVNGVDDEWHALVLAPPAEAGTQIDAYRDHADVWLPVFTRESHVTGPGLKNTVLGSDLCFEDLLVLADPIPPDRLPREDGAYDLELLRDDGSTRRVEVGDHQLTVWNPIGTSTRLVLLPDPLE